MIKQETIHDTGLKMTTKLAKSSYRDTGFLNNATTNERQRIIALSMYYQLGKFDPSNQFISTYSDKNMINRTFMLLVNVWNKINQIKVKSKTKTKNKNQLNTATMTLTVHDMTDNNIHLSALSLNINGLSED